MAHDHTSAKALIGSREGIAELMANLTTEEFDELCDALHIIASSHVPSSRGLAASDIRRTLYTASDRVADFHQQARAFHTAQRVNHAYGRAAA